jgi:hypothetical protein
MARLVRDTNGEAPRSTLPEPKKIIPDGEWLEINAVDVRMGGSDVAAMGAGDDAGGFGTDAAISRGRGGAEGRALQKWAPDVDDAQLLHLEESVTDTQRGWDQFALNEKKFGVRTDYREELYTTALDPNKSKISMAEAERLAAEIERGNKMDTTNIHLLEERGIEIDDGDMDEEDRYGAVIREVPTVGGVKRPTPPPPPRPAGAWGRGAPGGAPAATSAPISIDPRKEANKVRAHMTGGTVSGAKAGSPYGTPKQLASPLVGDAQKLAALNLNPGMPHVDEATRREFEAFKAAQQRGSAGSSGSLNVSEMKQFSEAVGSKLQKTVSADKPAAAAAGTAASTTPTTDGGDAAAAPKKTLGLNPNAKTFSLNINAREFTPTFTPKGAAPTPGPASTPPSSSTSGAPSSAGFRPHDPSTSGGGPGGPGPMPHYNQRGKDGPGGPGGPGGYDYRRQGGPPVDRRGGPHHMQGGGGGYPGGDAGGPPPPPPGHARSPPTGGMHMAGPGMPTMMHPGAPMGAPMMMGYLPPGAMPGGVGPRGAQMVYMPGPFMAGGPQMAGVPMRGVPMQMPMQMGYPGGPGMPYNPNQGGQGGGGGPNRGNSGHNQGGGQGGGDME